MDGLCGGKYQIEPSWHRAPIPQWLFHTTLSLLHRPSLVRGGTDGRLCIAAVGSVARILNGNQRGIQLDQLSVSDSEMLQEFLLPLVPME